MRHRAVCTTALILLFFIPGSAQTAPATKRTAPKTATSQPTVAEAEKFMKNAEADLLDVSLKQSRADWVNANFITDDTEAIAADADSHGIGAATKWGVQSVRFDKLNLPPELRRKMLLLKLSIPMPAPADAKERDELTKTVVSMQSDYGKGKYCPPATPDKCLSLPEIEKIMADPATNAEELKNLWVGWHKVGAPMRQRYSRFVELSNKGARELGFRDTGALWRSGYDMPPDAFAADLERIWQQVRPLYLSLHAYVRTQLSKKYGPQVVPPDGMIPAHLLGNMWGQEWGNIYPLVAPANADKGYDLTKLLQDKNTTPIQMVKYGEGFFTSLGFAPLPKTFWERSLFVKPQDREVVCHASAWDVDTQEDVRLKMCIQIRDEDFVTIHHELGHNFYQLAYRKQPYLFEDSANDGFHEAIGDTVALSVTPDYLVKAGLLPAVPQTSSDIGYLLKEALDKVAFLPFGVRIDQWRWKVFSGQIKPEDYNKSWWEMINQYQGLSAPVPRSEADFDPAAKYHVPANVPYTRYFLARIYQFQFYRALCKAAGYTGPLYKCSFYGNKAAGEKLAKALEMGKSRPWQEVMFELTGEKQGDASAMMEYFAPLKQWLDEQNKGQKIGW
jgi:peptidyl-dipeptidase A